MKKLFIPALIVLAITIIAVLVWQLLPQKAAISPSTEKPSLAIMYFENNTGDPNLDHWRKALSELLTADLSQSKYLTVMSGDKLFNILNDLNLLSNFSELRVHASGCNHGFSSAISYVGCHENRIFSIRNRSLLV